MTCTTSSASFVQQSVVHLGELNRYLHPVVPSITYYLPFGLVFSKTRGKNKQQDRKRLKSKSIQYLQGGCMYIFYQVILFLLIFSTNTLHNTLSKPLATFTSMLGRSMGHIITDKGQRRMIFIKITCMTCSVHCEQ